MQSERINQGPVHGSADWKSEVGALVLWVVPGSGRKTLADDKNWSSVGIFQLRTC